MTPTPPPSPRPPVSPPLEPASLDGVIARRLARRDILRGAGAGLALWAFHCAGHPSTHAGEGSPPVASRRLTYPRRIRAEDQVADGYRAEVVVRWGDPVLPGAPPFEPWAPSAAAQAAQFGFNADFVAFLPLPRGSASSDHGLLVVNHEYTTPEDMFHPHDAAGLTPWARQRIEAAAHGLSVVEVAFRADEAGERRWRVVPGPYARRLDALSTEFELRGPAAGHPRLRTSLDPTGRRAVGTLNNCGGGVTPWGTVLSAEENVDGYFGGSLPPGHPEARAHAAMGIPRTQPRGWHAHDPRYDLGREPNEPHRFGWIVEVDPYTPDAVPVKRTAMGRFKHEAATCSVAPDGRLVVFMGDDEAFQCVYRFVTARPVGATPEANRDLLDEGTLSVAQFRDDGTCRWLPLVAGTGGLTAAAGFASQADVAIDTRSAARRVGGTPMDRPEDVETNPVTGRVYVVLTNNKDRTAARVDAANPRAGNVHGHLLELVPPDREGRPDPTADVFSWSVFLRGGDPAKPADGAGYGPAMTTHHWLSCPDNVAFDRKGRLWIATDGAERAGIPDGVYACDTEGAGRAAPRMLYAAPEGAEICGPCFTPDGTTLFLAVQHPGEGSGAASPSTRWPDFDPALPPRPSVVALRRSDGGPVGG